MTDDDQDRLPADHTVSVVIPVYKGELTLSTTVAELAPYTGVHETPDGYRYVINEVLLVHDDGPDASDRVMRELADAHPYVRTIWLSRNFGQHAATLAGMASSGADWVVTMDEDGQHDPAAIAGMLDTAMRERASLVYAKPTNPAPHGALRNTASKLAKRTLERFVGARGASDYQSFRLILGSVARSVAAYSGSGVYLDVALSWVANRAVTSPVELRAEGDRISGYTGRRLFAHFLRMILTSGTRGLRFIAGLGILVAVIGVVFAIVVIVQRLTGDIAIEGWASTMVVLLLGIGAVLFSLGIIAEYIGINVNMAMGRPPYVIMSDPAAGPLGRRRPDNET